MGGEAASAASGNGGSSAKSGIVLDSRLLGVIAVAVLFIISLFLWTLPFQKNRLPFGEGDSAWHFAIGDDISSSDKATFRLPYYVGVWYYGFNRILGPFALEYPPSNHVNYALMQVFGGERFVPVLIYRAIASFLGVFAVFFLLSRLFGVLPAFIAGLGLIFSFREQMIFLWGQQPTLISLIIVPVVLYSWYSYLNSFYAGSERRAYLYITFALLASQFMLHLQGLLASLLIAGIFTALMFLKFRKLPVAKSNIAHFAAVLLAFSAVAAPFALIYLGVTSGSPPVSSLERLMQWNVPYSLVSGSFPEPFVLFSFEYVPLVRLFIFGGILLCVMRAFLVRPNNKELLFVSWLVGLFVIFHLDVFGIIDPGRVARMQVMEPALFFSLAALSVAWLPQTVSSLLKLGAGFAGFARFASAAKFFLAAVLIIALLSSGWSSTNARLKSAYGGIERITPVQAEFAAGVLHSLPKTAFIYDPVLPNVGGFSYTTWRYPKLRWMLAVSQRYVGRDFPDDYPHKIADKNEVYALFDYSDLALLASSSDQGTKQLGIALANELRAVELRMFNNTGAVPLYDGNNIRLYKYPYEYPANASSSESVPA